MQKETRYDTGSVVPRFHGYNHRLQLAFLVIIEEDEADGCPQLVIRPAKARLAKAKACLEESNAPDFVENFRKEEEWMRVVRKITGLLLNEKECNHSRQAVAPFDRQQGEDLADRDLNKL